MSKKKPRGRPRKTANTRKNEYLDLRLSADEKETFLIAAELAGIPISNWARERLRQAAVKELESARQPIPILKHVTLGK